MLSLFRKVTCLKGKFDVPSVLSQAKLRPTAVKSS